MQSRDFPISVLTLDSGDAASLVTTGTGYGILTGSATRKLGFFNLETMEAFGATIPGNLNKMSIAMSYKRPANAATTNAIKTSALNWIAPEDIYSISRVDYTPGQNQISDITWNASLLHCAEDFGIRVAFDNAHIRSIFPNGLRRSFVVAPVCNDADCNCPEVKCVPTIFNLRDVINQDVDKLISAEVGYYATAGDTSSFTAVADATAWQVLVNAGTNVIDTNSDGTADAPLTADMCPVLRITFNQIVLQGTYCNPNYNTDVNDVIVGAVYYISELNDDAMTVTEVQSVVKEIVPTRLVKDLEYSEMHTNWYGYRMSDIYPQPQLLVDEASYYTLYAIAYDVKQMSQTHSTLRHNGITYIAVPGAFASGTFTPGAVTSNIDNILSAIADEYNIETNL